MKLAYTGDLVLQEVENFSKDNLFKKFNTLIEKEEVELIVNLESPFINEGDKKKE